LQSLRCASLACLTMLLVAGPARGADGERVALAQARLAAVLVDVRVEVLEDPVGAYEPRPPTEALFDQFANQRISLRLPGVRISADGTVLVRDCNLPLHRYGRISLRDSQNRAWTGRVAGVMENHPAILLAPQEEPGTGEFIEFRPASLGPGESFILARPFYVEDHLCAAASIETGYTTAATPPGSDLSVLLWAGDSPGRRFLSPIPTDMALILDLEARPIGLALTGALWRTSDGRTSWAGDELMRDRSIGRDELDLIARVVRSRAQGFVREIEITFRPDSPLNQQLPLEDGKFFAYGVLLDGKGGLLVPSELAGDAIGQIETMAVREGERSLPAEFEGLLAEVGAFLVRAKGIQGAPADLENLPPLSRGRIFFTLSPRRRYGERYDRVDYNRYLDVALGYKERLHPLPQKAMRVGDFIFDAEGRLLGFYALMRQERSDELQAQLEGQSPAQPPGRVYLLSELRDAIRDPAAHIERAVRPRSRREEQRPVWLGVEFQPLDPSLARALRVEEPSRDGARGLLVTLVYPDSPAARLGVEAGDVLLSVVPPSGREFDLSPRGPWRQVLFANQPPGLPQRLWRPRRNYLTEVLGAMGEGTRVTLRLWRAGKTMDIPMTLERAPDDFDTAEEYREPALGMSVKGLTYEVRSVLRLAPDAPGVVVSQVQPGGAAALAQIRPFEIIVAVNDVAVRSPADFARLVRESASAGEVELLVTWLGESRIVRVPLAGAEP